MQQAFKFTTILALMLVLFIDGMGQGIIFPILTNSIVNPHATLFLHAVSQTTRNIWYGGLVGIYYLMWFISAPILGDWSDTVGRKKALLVCLALAAVGFLLSALAFDCNSLFMLFMGRLLGGATSGDQAIAKAAVIDLCPSHKKPIYLGLILFAVTLGLVIGPLIGSILQNATLVSWFNIKVPFYFALLLAVMNFFLIRWCFTETLAAHPLKKIKWLQAITLFTAAFSYKRIRNLLISYCLTQTAWQTFYIYTPYFVVRKFHLSAMQASSMLALIGIGIGIGLSLLPSLCKNINQKRAALFGYLGLLGGILMFLLANNPLFLWLSIVPTASLFGLAAVNILSLFSDNTSAQRQGWIMGITGSVVALTGGIAALLSGLLAGLGLATPYVFASIATFVGILILRKVCIAKMNFI